VHARKVANVPSRLIKNRERYGYINGSAEISIFLKAMIEAILWDNDGVLVDTERLVFESTRRTLAKIGIEFSLEQFLELSVREGRSALRLATENGWEEQQIADLKYLRARR
jgi:phosphoglycolate phosphatase-like HAD superfamily hydrolase